MNGNGIQRQPWTTFYAVLSRRRLAMVPCVAFAIGLAAGWATAPGQHSLQDHSHFSEFFAASAGVIATLFVGFALGARVYLVGPGLAVLTLLLVGVSEAAAITALSPSLPSGLYAPLMGVTIGGGIGALLAALISAARALADERHRLEQEGLHRLGERPS